MNHGSLFSGIGGFDLAAEWMGWENRFHCEWNEFGQKVLKYYWPNAISYGDIKKTDFNVWRGKIDIISGGFPCQPYSQAGKRKGKEDDRHLWPEMLRAVREIQPRWVVGENVSGLLNWNRGMVLDEIKADLETAGFEVIPPLVLPACAVNAPHRRDRVWIVAYSKSQRINREKELENYTGQSGERGRCDADNACQISNKDRESNVANANSYGCDGSDGSDGSDGKNEKHTSYGRFDALNDIKPVITPNSDSNRQANGYAESIANKSGHDNRGYTENDASNSENNRLEGHGGFREIKKTERDIGAICYNERGSVYNNPDTKQRQQYWSNFPTQSPICSRNDGIPGGLVGITIPKHRVESIKAYGNSIVPQVVFEIFKTIEQYERAMGSRVV